jgi:ornithine cyclodeaminase/alanine dehydrogenase-like protein (mu-crystallin family)
MTTAQFLRYLDEATTDWLLDRFDPVGVAARVLAYPPENVVAIPLPADSGLIVVAEPVAGRVLCLISSQRFQEVRTVSTVVALARSLVVGRLPVVCVLGGGRREDPYVEHLLRGVPGIVQVMVCRPGPVLVSPASGERHRHGVTVAVTGSVREAVEGADLVLVVTPPAESLDPRWLASYAAVLDTTGAVDLAGLGTRLSHAVSPGELASVAAGLASAVYRAALDHSVGVLLSR